MQRKAKGLIPRNAKIGGGIAIHGTWPHDDMAVDLYQNWTNGCISLKNEDVDELYDMLPVGTTVADNEGGESAIIVNGLMRYEIWINCVNPLTHNP